MVNRLFKRRSKKTSKLRATGLCVVNWPVTDKFPAQCMFDKHRVINLYKHGLNSKDTGSGKSNINQMAAILQTTLSDTFYYILILISLEFVPRIMYS